MTEFPEARLQVLLLLILLRRLETLLQILLTMGEGVSVHNTNIMNNVRLYLPEVADQQVSLLLQMLQIHGWIVER